MRFEFKLPDIGEGVVEGEVVKWLVNDGDAVQAEQPVVEIMTDKATVVIPSPKAGKVVQRSGKEGEMIKVHSTLLVLETEGGAAREVPSPAWPPSRPRPSRRQPRPRLKTREPEPRPRRVKAPRRCRPKAVAAVPPPAPRPHRRLRAVPAPPRASACAPPP